MKPTAPTQDASPPPKEAAASDSKQAPSSKADPLRINDRRHASHKKAEASPAKDDLSVGEVVEDAAFDNAQAVPQNPEADALAQKLLQSEALLNNIRVQYKEALDEFNEAKARIRRDVGKEIDAGKRSILVELLEVVDNLERAIEAAKSAGEADDGFFRGVCMVRDQFGQKLANLGVTRREAANQPFDPDHFEAISTVPVTNPEQDGVVVGVVRDCYMLGNETLRHGMVAVGKLTAS